MIKQSFIDKKNAIKKIDHFVALGRITKVSGLVLEAKGLNVSLGSLCDIMTVPNIIKGQVIGFSDDLTYLMPIEPIHHLKPGTQVKATNQYPCAPVSHALLGRIMDGFGRPIDDKGPIPADEHRSLHAQVINPLSRPPIREPLDVGIRAINGLITVAKGQRMGLFAGSGVGKSVLLGMMTKFTKAQVVVIALIGERGREVREFIEKSIGPEGLKKTVIIASPADSSAVQRVEGAHMAATIAEYFRDEGLDVLLIMDSLTRYAHAKRQISLSVGEPPAHKGYTPSVFFDLAQLIERAGLKSDKGSITAFYTVLAEGDDLQDPIVDSTRSLLDGHIILSRHMAEMGVYPAIDIESSISRVMTDVISPEHHQLCLKFKKYYALYQENKDLILVGAYQKGTNPELDLCIHHHQNMMQYISQGFNEAIYSDQAKQQLSALFSNSGIEPTHDAP